MKRPFEDLGKTLTSLRQSAGLTQIRLAERAGITKPMVSTYERSATRPSLETLEKILAALGRDVEDLGRELKRVQRSTELARRVMEGEVAAEAVRAAASRQAQADEVIETAKIEVDRTLERVRERILEVVEGGGPGAEAEGVRQRDRDRDEEG